MRWKYSKYIFLEGQTEETPDEGSGDQQEDATTESEDSSTTEDPIIFPTTTSPDGESISDSGKRISITAQNVLVCVFVSTIFLQNTVCNFSFRKRGKEEPDSGRRIRNRSVRRLLRTGILFRRLREEKAEKAGGGNQK